MNIKSNLRVYLKFLSKNKLYSAVSILGFSVSLMFVILLSVYVRQELSADDFHEKKDRIYAVMHEESNTFSNPVAPFVAANCPEVESFVRLYGRTAAVGVTEEKLKQEQVLFADSTFFNIFSFGLKSGDASEVLKRQNMAVISETFAQSIFHDRDPIGQRLLLDEVEYTVTGIMNDLPINTQIPKVNLIVNYEGIEKYWGNNRSILEQSYNFGFSMYFLEKENSNLKAKTETLLDLFKDNFWYYKKGFSSHFEFIPLQDAYFKVKQDSFQMNKNNKTLLLVYIGIAVLILIIATLNYINMTVAQASFRGKESAIKKLLGCSRKGIITQILGESILMTSFTFLVGLFLAFLAEPIFNDLLNTRLDLETKLTFPLVLFSCVFVLVIAMLSGLLPALVISSFKPIEIVKGSFMRKMKSQFSKPLIAFQYTVAISLIVVSLFIIKQSNFLMHSDMGYNRDRIITMYNSFTDSVQWTTFPDVLRQLPGVEIVSATCGTPMDEGNNFSFDKDGEQFSFQELVVDSAFFRLFGITIEPTGILPTYDTYWVNEIGFNALRPDKKTFEVDMGHGTKRQIAGIISPFNYRTLHQAIGQMRMRMLRPTDSPWSFSVKVADNADLYATAKLVGDTYREMRGGMVSEVQFADDIIQSWYEKEEKTAKIISAFAILTVLISTMGVFAMSLYQVQQRRKEIGVRKVNGATEMEIIKMFNLTSVKIVGVSFLIACPISYYAINRWLESFAFKITITPWEFLIGGLLILVITVLSITALSWRASRLNPVEVLKSE